MENFLGYGTSNSAYDGRRHIACLLTVYASYKIQVNPNAITAVKSALGMPDYTQSHQYLLKNLYDSDFYQFVESLGRRYNVSNTGMKTKWAKGWEGERGWNGWISIGLSVRVEMGCLKRNVQKVELALIRVEFWGLSV